MTPLQFELADDPANQDNTGKTASHAKSAPLMELWSSPEAGTYDNGILNEVTAIGKLLDNVKDLLSGSDTQQGITGAKSAPGQERIEVPALQLQVQVHLTEALRLYGRRQLLNVPASQTFDVLTQDHVGDDVPVTGGQTIPIFSIPVPGLISNGLDLEPGEAYLIESLMGSKNAEIQITSGRDVNHIPLTEVSDLQNGKTNSLAGDRTTDIAMGIFQVTTFHLIVPKTSVRYTAGPLSFAGVFKGKERVYPKKREPDGIFALVLWHPQKNGLLTPDFSSGLTKKSRIRSRRSIM